MVCSKCLRDYLAQIEGSWICTSCFASPSRFEQDQWSTTNNIELDKQDCPTLAKKLDKLTKIPITFDLSFVFFFVFLIGFSLLDLSFSLIGHLCLVYGFVILHEYGHIFAGHRLGLTTQRITVYPFGAAAHMDLPATSAKTEILVALAGPAVNFFFAVIFSLIYLLAPYELILLLVSINLVLGIFNLFPVYPMDGGRVLRGVLWYFTDFKTGLRLAVRFGQILGLILAISFLFYSLWISVIFFLMLLSGQKELNYFTTDYLEKR